ncbi:MAG: ABC transporter permease [Bacteroidota bacterium]|nr:ABC transporter permease [Bacteroidota bacterium]
MNKIEESTQWDLILTPQKGWFKLDLGAIWRYRDLLMLLVRRDIVAFYKQTIFGPLWYFIQPVFTTIVFTFIFGKLAKLSTDGLPQSVFYLVGITAWNYFSDCLIKTSTVFRDNQAIFGKVYFPRIISPLSIVVSNLLRFAIQLVLLLGLIIYFYFQGVIFPIGWNIFLFPVFILFMAMQGLGLGMMVTAMTNKYKDLSILVPFGMQLLMYATTVIYPLSSLSGNMYRIVALNPMTYVIEGIKASTLGVGVLTFQTFTYSFLVSVFILSIGYIIFNKAEKSFIDTI